jgi:hypothetical protein
MIVIGMLSIVYSPQMGPPGMVIVSPMNKKVDLAVETRKRSIKNNVIHLLNVEIVSVLVLVKNETQTQTNKTKPHV